MNDSYKISVNQEEYLEVNEADLDDLDLVINGPDDYHLLDLNKSYRIEVVGRDFERKKYLIKVNDHTLHVTIKTVLDQLIDNLGFNSQQGPTMTNIKAPMPGKVMQILVGAGDEIKKGDSLIILEAMKMENVIKATGVGQIGVVHAVVGQGVEKNQLLIEMI